MRSLRKSLVVVVVVGLSLVLVYPEGNKLMAASTPAMPDINSILSKLAASGDE